MERRELKQDEIKAVYTLNTWTDLEINEAKDWLEKGYYVLLGSSALGHTSAEMTENKGIKLIKDIYGDRVEVVIREGWGSDWRYCHLLKK